MKEQLGQAALKRKSSANLACHDNVAASKKNGIENSSSMMNVPANLHDQLQAEIKNALKWVGQ